MFLYPYQDTDVSLSLIVHGCWEKYETQVFRKIVKKDMVVVDIGAHIGYYTLIAAELVGLKGKVFAFEPDPDNYNLLVKNIKLNGYTNIISVKKAISNKTGKAKLFMSSKNKSSSQLYHADSLRESIVVDVTTLDEFFKDYDGKVNLIKVDIEGAEMAAFQGMANLIRKNDDLAIFTEFCPRTLRRTGSSPEEYLSKLEDMGFKIYHIDEQKECMNLIDAAYATRLCHSQKFTNLLCELHKQSFKNNAPA